MSRFLPSIRPDAGLLIVRLGVGLMFALVHGWPKITGGPAAWAGLGKAFGRLLGIEFFPEFWGFLAAASESFGGLCLVLGVAFRPACGLMAFTMAVAAAANFRGGHGFAGASQALELGGVLLGLAFTGPGRWTVIGWKRTEEDSRLRRIDHQLPMSSSVPGNPSLPLEKRSKPVELGRPG